VFPLFSPHLFLLNLAQLYTRPLTEQSSEPPPGTISEDTRPRSLFLCASLTMKTLPSKWKVFEIVEDRYILEHQETCHTSWIYPDPPIDLSSYDHSEELGLTTYLEYEALSYNCLGHDRGSPRHTRGSAAHWSRTNNNDNYAKKDCATLERMIVVFLHVTARHFRSLVGPPKSSARRPVSIFLKAFHHLSLLSSVAGHSRHDRPWDQFARNGLSTSLVLSQVIIRVSLPSLLNASTRPQRPTGS
jgi:hypothetical protein